MVSAFVFGWKTRIVVCVFSWYLYPFYLWYLSINYNLVRAIINRPQPSAFERFLSLCVFCTVSAILALPFVGATVPVARGLVVAGTTGDRDGRPYGVRLTWQEMASRASPHFSTPPAQYPLPGHGRSLLTSHTRDRYGVLPQSASHPQRPVLQ